MAQTIKNPPYIFRRKLNDGVCLRALLSGSACLFLPAVHAQDVQEVAAEANSSWLWNFLGHLHPLAVHFPVALILFAAILELFTLKNFDSKLRPGINLLVIFGVLSAVISALLGLLLAGTGDYGKDLLTLHQWTGIATASLGAIALYLSVRLRKKTSPGLVSAYRAILFVTTFGISVAGHFGASLTHGSDYISETVPWSEDYKPLIVTNLDVASLKNDTGKLDKKQEIELNTQVRSILAHNCYKCHGADKVKGELRLDRKDMVFKGGEHGLVITPGNPMESEMVKRITLPAGHKKAMPSKEKRLSASEIDIIKLWIQKGAPWPADKDKDVLYRVAELQPRNPALPAVSAGFQNPVDLWVNEYFKQNKIAWTKPVDDRTYLRRISLDIIGLLPSPEEERAFAADNTRAKRALWVRV
ncbi:MAG: c-type cytochrome domain-containing protein [Ferruginibacter sp.]